MSDGLSTDSGRALLENAEELRAAQARMAALLRDEPVPAVSASNVNDLAAIAELKKNGKLCGAKVQSIRLRLRRLEQVTNSIYGWSCWQALRLLLLRFIGFFTF